MKQAKQRLGLSATEVIVAATLLLSMLGLVVPTTMRAARILRDARHYQIAMNELSNQFEYLSCLSETELASALPKLQISDQAQQSLENASLAASLSNQEDGVRITLSLNWERGVDAKPLQLTGWLSSKVAEASAVQEDTVPAKENSNAST
ncbi:MAG: hypothetical protein SFV81_26280 [Pirellulaceae bacterium]|nr:hypothetical protein [Pirellulaceae bacterium]